MRFAHSFGVGKASLQKRIDGKNFRASRIWMINIFSIMCALN
ncbi:hypothetical protein X961_4222 [Burkholderia pseudomallei MSHR5613]|nr:hypothetical protein DO62_5710 [Burkholderia pseudomallei]KGS01340.1 hypothetical protein X977_4624 [Burkholderia pseudomallei MSHR7504]KGS39968.1 hypothetical protein X945_4399 [Burkholderia pseudomallei ABCPW 107]KGS47302.1 hypothetical protein X961_4222 [Burkholderia pseudomallei MSHR5613]KGS75541.1 hypothetical protein X976_4191 [Burkholderia pseudomallei MSHR7500]KGX69591.1 hypothetical protein Y026_4325 [Burkholderia pseudomallei TSV28]KGX98571.1 hypothetical protein Y023_4205 [Burkh